MHRFLVGSLMTALAACGGRGPDPYDLDFEAPKTEAFAPSLSSYGLYADAKTLSPAAGVFEYDIASELFTDYADKQRLVKPPAGQPISRTGQALAFPEGTVLAKTFAYTLDQTDPGSERRLIETRLLVKTDNAWNAATYIWNDEQSEALLQLEGATTAVEWISPEGVLRSIEYAVPHEGECYTCHQSGGAAAAIGPKLANLDREVERDGEVVDQLSHLADRGVLDATGPEPAKGLPDYSDPNIALEERARAYLEINCAHCHNPMGWDEASGRELDFRYTTPLAETGLQRVAVDLPRILQRGRMPYLGTTMVHTEGVELLERYVQTLSSDHAQR